MSQSMNEVANWFYAIGGQLSIGAFLVCIIKMYIDYSFNEKMNKTIEKLKADYNKKVYAYSFLLRKEIAYYEKVDFEYADLIVDIQDIYFYIAEASEVDMIDRKNKCKELLLKILQQTPRLKSHLLVAHCYLPDKVNNSSMELITYLQSSCQQLSDIGSNFILAEKADHVLLGNIKNTLLLKIAIVNSSIKERMESIV